MGSQDSLFRGVPSRSAKVEVSMDRCGPWALLTEGALAGEVKIKWV